MVGPWQVPVADVAVTATGFDAVTGEAMAMGERPPVALLNPRASARLAITEALTNLAAARVTELGRVVLSANWMAACGENAEDQALFEAVCEVGETLCPALGIAVPVGKDSLSMRTRWQQGDVEKQVVSPLTLNVTAFAPVDDVRLTLTPRIVRPADEADTLLVLVDLTAGRSRLGGSALAQCFRQLGDTPPDLDDPDALVGFFAGMRTVLDDGLALAYHDRSDGGLIVTVLEMAFAGRCGVDLNVDGGNALAVLFAEEPGVVLQVRRSDLERVTAAFDGLTVSVVGAPRPDADVTISVSGRKLLASSRAALQRAWTETSHQLQRLRDDPGCADEEFEAVADDVDPGLAFDVRFGPREAPAVGRRPRIAVLREQGVNGQLEMAAAFDRAGFEAVDVHMTDVLSGAVSLDDHAALVACGGFSYGDVLGGGGGWAKSILYHGAVRDAFAQYFDSDRLVLGICNGCQMLAQLQELIPRAGNWPRFVRNRSEQFEGRTVLVRLNAVASPWLDDMAGSVLPVAVAHGEGRAEFADPAALTRLNESGGVASQYVDGRHRVATTYPFNPNGAPDAIAGVVAANGRVLAMMPHPERMFRAAQNVIDPGAWDERGNGPWLRLFQNARAAIG